MSIQHISVQPAPVSVFALLISCARIFGILMNLVKPFLSENASEGLVFHG